MVPDDTVHEDVRFLTGSPQRFAVLTQLCEGPARPTELCDAVDATRTTIQRILAGFRERQWVVKRDGVYRPTVTGRRVHDRYRALLSEVDRAREFGPLAEHLGPVGDQLPAELLETGTLTVGSEQSPLAAVRRFTEWFRNVEGDVRAVSPIVTQSFNEIAAGLLESGTHIELIIDHGVLERSMSDFTTAVERGIEDDNVAMFVHESPLEVGLVLDASRCCLIAYDGRNNVRAMVESDDDTVYDWGEAAFERRRDRSQSLEAVISSS